jgi:hypothetical protein
VQNGGNRRGRRLAVRAVVGAVTIVLAWFLLLCLPFVRGAVSSATGSGSTVLDALVPADPSFRLSVSATGRVVTATGETSLPDSCRVQVWAAAVDAGGGLTAAPSEAVVHGGRFAATLDLSGWPPVEVKVVAVFRLTSDQPANVIERFGTDGSRLAGPRVVPVWSGFDDSRANGVEDWQIVALHE